MDFHSSLDGCLCLLLVEEPSAFSLQPSAFSLQPSAFSLQPSAFATSESKRSAIRKAALCSERLSGIVLPVWSRFTFTCLALCTIFLSWISSAQTEDYPDCAFILLNGNGNCEATNNIADCGYDGGDCCECTCVNGTFTCGGLMGYDCQDPTADCSTSSTSSTGDDEYSNCGSAWLIGNGNCEATTNNADCGYDGGDCCPCTCVDGTVFACGGLLGYDCQDPSANCSTSTSNGDGDSNCGSTLLAGNGNCDVIGNSAECGYDGGDCCPCTCVDSASFTCGGWLGYDCQDPSANCSTSTGDEEYPDCDSTLLNGNGNCEATNNNADCGYDGGDCCPCTCIDSASFTCGGLLGYDCQDPSANCSTTTSNEDGDSSCGSTLLNGNGNCEATNNNADCGYDGGDCCPCTCVDGTVFSCGGLLGYDCQDPSANCATSTSDEEYPDCDSTLLNGNGNCEAINNNADCGYDGGDCCPCTCVNGTVFSCGGLLGYDCQDPSANCATSTSDEEYPSCLVPAFNGNGNCDPTNNNADCGYDGGDCCPCTCVDGPIFACGGLLGYTCQDPSASCVGDTKADVSLVTAGYNELKTQATIVTAAVLSGAALLLLLAGYF